MQTLPSPLIRSATGSDLKAVSAVILAAFAPFEPVIGRRPAPMDDDHAAQIGTGGVTVAELAGEVVGVMVLRRDGSDMVVDTLAVGPAHQGRGIGRGLLAEAERAARKAGHSALRLVTNEAMAGAAALYRAAGYAEAGRAVENGYRRIRFRKDLGPAIR